MARTLLIIDVSNLAWRAYYNRAGATVAFGFFRDLLRLRERFSPDGVAFCFDGGTSLREKLFPGYKLSRRVQRQNDPLKRADHKAVKEEIDKLRVEYLPGLGYGGVYHQPGYEADDLVAALARQIHGSRDSAVVASTDQDLYQLLADNVSICKTPIGPVYTAAEFRSQFDLPPADWPSVKAIAGCSTDDIPGLKGVGEITAAKWLAGKLSPKDKRCPEIFKWYVGRERRRNLKLVALPFMAGAGMGEVAPPWGSSAVTPAAWDGLMARLGIVAPAGGRKDTRAAIKRR